MVQPSTDQGLGFRLFRYKLNNQFECNIHDMHAVAVLERSHAGMNRGWKTYTVSMIIFEISAGHSPTC